MDTVKSQLETLVEDSQGNVNYESWRFKLDLTLKSKKLFDIATGVKIKPTGSDESEAVASWIAKDVDAQTLIGLNCGSKEDIKVYVSLSNDTKTRYFVWKKITSVY